MKRNAPFDSRTCPIYVFAAGLFPGTAWAAPPTDPAEPNVEVASAWWPEMENTWVLYSLLTGSMSRRTVIGCERRGGASGTLFSVPIPIELARLSVIDDQLEPDRLHLPRLVPLAWLRADRPTTFERIATEFGPVTLCFQLEDNARRLRVAFQPQFRHEPQSISLHVPPLDGLSEIAVGDRVPATHPGDVIALK